MTFPRHLAIPLHRALRSASPLLLEGPRGSGKTTLLRHELPSRLYIDLNDPADRAAAQRDPRAFLASLRREAIVDHLLRAPALVRYLAAAEQLDLPIVFAASVNLPLRMPTLELHFPTRAERQRRPAMPLELLGRFEPSAPAPQSPAAEIPPFPQTRDFLHRDVPQIVKLEEESRFERFLDLIEQNSGDLLHQQALARQLGVAQRTVVRWLDVLNACFLTLSLSPFDLTFGRRIARRPRLHWLGATANFSTQVVTEIYRNACHSGQAPVLRYWRDSNGLEVPLIVQQEPDAPPVPVAIAEVPNPAHEAALRRWMRLADAPAGAIIGQRPARPSFRTPGVLRYALHQF